METVLVFEPSRQKREELIKCVRSCLDRMGTRHVEFLCFNPEDVFTGKIPETALAAFFTLKNMTGAEAARKFGQYRENIPLVIVSDTDEYAGESWSYGARYYLTHPITKDLMSTALRKCARL